MKITKTFLLLLVIAILAFTLRLITAYYVDVGSDEMIYTLIPLNIIDAGRLSTVEQAPVYFYLTDLGYKLTGGMNGVTGRLPSIFFGSAAIFLIYLITQLLFKNKTISLLSAFFLAVSGYAIRYNQEMDMTTFFLALLSIYFFILVLQGEDKKLYFAALFLALAVMCKPIVLLFVPAYIIIWILKERSASEKKTKWSISKERLKIILLSLLLCIIIVTPVLTYNYFLYKEKGFTDYYFSVLGGLGSNQIYQGQEAQPWTFQTFFNVLRIIITRSFHFDTLLLLLGIIGIILTFKTKEFNMGQSKTEKYTCLLLLSTSALLILYIAGKMGSPTHYVWISIILSIFSGYAITTIADKIRHRFHTHHLTAFILILVTISTIMIIKETMPLREKSAAIALRTYSQQNIEKESLVVLDPRIYRGIYAWAFNDLHYLEGTSYPQLINSINQIKGMKTTVPLYYIECAPGTNCGWKPEDFQRIAPAGEKLSEHFKKQTQKIAEVGEAEKFYIYKGSATVPSDIFPIIDQTHMHWYTPVAWKHKENAIDNYTPKTTFDKLLNSFAFLILYLDVAIALVSLLVPFYLLLRKSG